MSDRIMLKSKIHGATITGAKLNYEGSITIDKDLIQAANLVPHEQVHVLNIVNGARFETYVIEGKSGSGEICINGAAARLVQKGDIVLILSYSIVKEEDCPFWKPIIVKVDSNNHLCN